MNDIEARVRCMELAYSLIRPGGDYSVQSVVDNATVLYTFAKSSTPDESPAAPVDKPKRGKKAEPDILS